MTTTVTRNSRPVRLARLDRSPDLARIEARSIPGPIAAAVLAVIVAASALVAVVAVLGAGPGVELAPAAIAVEVDAR